MNLRNNVELVLETKRRDDESWGNVFNRINPSGALDQKTCYRLIVCLLEELDGREKENSYEPVTARPEDTDISGQVGDPEEGVRSGVEDGHNPEA